MEVTVIEVKDAEPPGVELRTDSVAEPEETPTENSTLSKRQLKKIKKKEKWLERKVQKRFVE